MIVIPLFVLGTNLYVKSVSEKFIFSDINLLPKHKVGLVLGTSKYNFRSNINFYYANRIDATVSLYKANKIDFVLVSGDNGHSNYNEPKTFKRDLIAKGIPENKIFLDYAGFRTLDSILRAQKVFGLNAFIIISQKFHVERALFIARSNHINAIGFSNANYSNTNNRKLKFREVLAKTKAVLDVMFNKKAKFYGKQITIE